MERGVAASGIFVLFASKSGAESPWVNFELEEARVQLIIKSNYRILVFPTSPDFDYRDLPEWLQSSWIVGAGWTAPDIARYITTLILENGTGQGGAALQVVGRGATSDHMSRLLADHVQRNGRMPNVYALSGFAGIGRRTFAKHFMATTLAASANLRFGPTLSLPAHAELSDLYFSIRNDISIDVAPSEFSSDLATFRNLSEADQVNELHRLLSHYKSLKQAVVLVSTSGFFEDRGQPKSWVSAFLSGFTGQDTVFLITNRMFDDAFVNEIGNLVQMRIEELDNKDVKTLMVFTALRLGVDGFVPSENIVKAIGGHADVANAAVRLAKLKGLQILERDPRQLYNIQNTILGENVDDDTLNLAEKTILLFLGWVPALGADLLLQMVTTSKAADEKQYLEAIQSLMLGCMIVSNGFMYSISPAIRYMFRRRHVTPPDLVKVLSDTLRDEWAETVRLGRSRKDLLDAFIFMHALEGSALPKELYDLLTPGSLQDILKDMYQRGKDSENKAELEQVVAWGEMATDMHMSESTREEILSTVARAQTRLGAFSAAEATIAEMTKRNHRGVLFLNGHLNRKRRSTAKAIPFLKQAIKDGKYRRSAVQELALCYRKEGRHDELADLLKEHGDLLKDSALFLDIRIAIDIFRGDIKSAEAGIEALRNMPDEDGRADLKFADLQARSGQNRQAKELLTKLLNRSHKNLFEVRMRRGLASAKSGDFSLARDDWHFVKSLPGRAISALQLEATILNEEGHFSQAQSKLEQLRLLGEEDHYLQAEIWEKQASSPQTGLALRAKLLSDADASRAKARIDGRYHIDD